MTHSLYL